MRAGDRPCTERLPRVPRELPRAAHGRSSRRAWPTRRRARPGRSAADARPAVGQLDVVHGSLELVGGDRNQPFPKYGSSLRDRTGGHGCAAARAGAHAEAGHRGVTLHGGDIGDVHAERIGRELDDGGLQAVPRRAAGDEDRGVPGGLDANGGRFGGEVQRRWGRGFDIVRQPDAEEAPRGTGPGLFATERLVVEHRQRLLERLERGDVVVHEAAR